MPRPPGLTSAASPAVAAANTGINGDRQPPDQYRGGGGDSLSRVGSVGKGSIGRFSDISGGSAATRHWVNSVSDIYGPDEIEELLEDLNRLELAAFETEEFDIDGSQAGVNGDRRRRRRSRLVSSPTFSVRSWDSHAIYESGEGVGGGNEADRRRPGGRRLRGQEEEGGGGDCGTGGDCGENNDNDCDIGVLFPARSLQAIFCFCDTSTLRTPRTLLRILLLVTSLACLSTVVTAGTAKTGLVALPQFPRLRAMMFLCIFTILFTVFILFLNISHMSVLLPVDMGKMQTAVYLLLTIAYVTTSALLLHTYPSTSYGDHSEPSSNWTKNLFFAASILGLACSVETFLCMFNCGPEKPYNKMLQESSTHLTLPDSTAMTRLPAPSAPPSHEAPDLAYTEQYIVNENYRQQQQSVTKHKNNQKQREEKPSKPSSSPAAAAAVKKDAVEHNPSKKATSATAAAPFSSTANGCYPPQQGSPPPPTAASFNSKSSKQQPLPVPAEHPPPPSPPSPCKPTQSSASPPPPSDAPASSLQQHRRHHHRSDKPPSEKHLSDQLPPTTEPQVASTAAGAAAASATTAKTTTTKALVTSEPPPGKSTGAIPKKKPRQHQQSESTTSTSNVKPSTNHLDEIVALPLDGSSGNTTRQHQAPT